jgi:hypothetical protein
MASPLPEPLLCWHAAVAPAGKEAGYNAIAMSSLSHSWVRDVTIVNADSGVFIT